MSVRLLLRLALVLGVIGGAFVGASACIEVGVPGETVDAGVDAYVPPTCDYQSNCESCALCAAGTFCATVYQLCAADPGCQAIAYCMGNCFPGDQECATVCTYANQESVPTYTNTALCLYCQACPSDCFGKFLCAQ